MRRNLRRQSLRPIGLSLLLMLQAGCADPTGTEVGSAVFFPQWSLSGNEVPAGALEGRLTLRDDCLLWDAGEQGLSLPLWRDTFSLNEGSPPSVVTEDGQVIEVGDTAILGGGERVLADAEEMIGREIPPRCQVEGAGYWLATDLATG